MNKNLNEPAVDREGFEAELKEYKNHTNNDDILEEISEKYGMNQCEIVDLWIQTNTGLKFNPYAPDPETIDITDIANALSKICRFNGHSNKFYSVAEHSAHVADMLPAELKFAGLMHDAAEAYIGDMSRPIKHYDRGFKTMERVIQSKIFTKFGIQHTQMEMEIVSFYDSKALKIEKDALFSDDLDWGVDSFYQNKGEFKIQCWDHHKACEEFLQMFNKLYPGKE